MKVEHSVVTLRNESNGKDVRHLCAYLDSEGNLHIDGHDIGPATAPVSPDGEYEWFKTIRAAHMPRLLTMLGARPTDDVLTLLGEKWSGARSYELERILRETSFPLELSVR